jgi:hypothetical protein
MWGLLRRSGGWAPLLAKEKTIRTIGRKSIITLSIDPAVLAKADSCAKRRGLSRAAAIAYAVSLLQ